MDVYLTNKDIIFIYLTLNYVYEDILDNFIKLNDLQKSNFYEVWLKFNTLHKIVVMKNDKNKD